MELLYGIAFAFLYIIARAVFLLMSEIDIKKVRINGKTLRTDIVALVIAAICSWLFAVGMIIVFALRKMLVACLFDYNTNNQSVEIKKGSK